MSGGETKNSALTTTIAFHYQVLIGIEQCFNMKEGQSIWFERDGDVSLVAPSNQDAIQFEVKKYDAPLTDHHENFWNTLKNWLAPDFQHVNYGSLVLLTTQAFGVKSSLDGWNDKTLDERLDTIKAIYASRTEEELDAEKPKSIVQLQKSVMAADEAILKAVLGKMCITTEADDLEVLRAKIKARFHTIPTANRDRCIELLVGFVYECANEDTGWPVSKKQFDDTMLEIGSKYSRREFAFPEFSGRNATEDEQQELIDKLFVKKIQEIEYGEVIPEAMGNWIEYSNSIEEELDGYPQYKKYTVQYQKQLVSQFNRKYALKKRRCQDVILDSKDLYDEITSESPYPTENQSVPHIACRNGLIHDAMDDENLSLQWKIEP